MLGCLDKVQFLSFQVTGVTHQTRFIYFYFICLCVLSACISVNYIYVLPTEARIRYSVPWDWSSRWLWASMWVLGSKPGASERAASATKHWAISPVLQSFFWDRILFNQSCFQISTIWLRLTETLGPPASTTQCWDDIYHYGWIGFSWAAVSCRWQVWYLLELGPFIFLTSLWLGSVYHHMT